MERVRLVEDTALKAAGCKNFAGSIPVLSVTLRYSKMDSHTLNNWVKIKETFEKSGNTDNHFYKRACAIIKTGKDPLENYLSGKVG